MGFGSRAFLAGGLGFAVAFVVACGSSTGLLSTAQSSRLAGDLHTVSTALAAHDCSQVQHGLTALNNDITNLPSSINSTLLNNLGQGAGTLSQLASRSCSSSSTTSSTPTTTTTTTTTPTTTSSSTTSSATTTVPPTTSSSTSSSTSTATNPTASGTSTAPTGGATLGGTGTAGQGGNGQ